MSAADSINDSGVYAGALLARNGRGDEVVLNPALVAYVWDESSNVAEAARDSVDELVRVRPDAVCPHGGTGDLLRNLSGALETLRKALPDAEHWAGVGIDGTIEAWQRGKLTAEQVVSRHREVARLLERLGVRVAVLNGEGKWALLPDSIRSVADIKALAAAIGRAYQEHAPSVVVMLSSYGRLGHHARIRALIEGITPFCSAFTGQSYAARKGEVRRGVLPTILELDERSQAATVRQGWMRPDAPGDASAGDTADDLDRLPTVQAHKTDSTDLCTALCERYHVLVWSLPTIREDGRADEAGLDAFASAVRIRAEAGPGPGCVRRFQAARELDVDGRAGKMTRGKAKS